MLEFEKKKKKSSKSLSIKRVAAADSITLRSMSRPQMFTAGQPLLNSKKMTFKWWHEVCKGTWSDERSFFILIRIFYDQVCQRKTFNLMFSSIFQRS